MADLATLQTRLTEAETALHKLATGSQEETAEHGDIRVTYTRADIGKLQSYIEYLRTQIVSAGGTVTGLRRRAFVIDL